MSFILQQRAACEIISRRRLVNHCRHAYSYSMDPSATYPDESGEEWLAVPPALLESDGPPSPSEQQIRLWALVLQACAIPCDIVQPDSSWQLLVPASCFNRAVEELRRYHLENRNWPPPAPPARGLAENTLATLSVLLLLATFYNITLLDVTLAGNRSVDWYAIGAAQTAKILDGEWWRLVTALTLHANLPHLLGNLTIGGIFVVCLCRELGSGLAWTLLLCSGILGNLINALLQPSQHTSVGASTVVFGAVGILSASNLLRYRHQRQKRWGLPLSGALALLAVLGTEGAQTDLGAHLFGFIAGVVLGLCAEYQLLHLGRPSRAFGLLLAGGSAAIIIAAWWAALFAHGHIAA